MKSIKTTKIHIYNAASEDEPMYFNKEMACVLPDDEDAKKEQEMLELNSNFIFRAVKGRVQELCEMGETGDVLFFEVYDPNGGIIENYTHRVDIQKMTKREKKRKDIPEELEAWNYIIERMKKGKFAKDKTCMFAL